MADRDDPTAPDLPPRPPTDDGGDARTRATVTWRGIVDEPVAPEPRKKRSLLSPIGALFDKVLVALGVKRAVNEDGTPGDRHLGRFATIVGGVAVTLLIVSMVHITRAGYVTVPVTAGNAQKQLGEGLHVTLPWPVVQVSNMSVQTQNYTMTAQKLAGTDDPVRVEGADGAFAMVDATLLYRLDADHATDVYRTVGADYRAKLVIPSARSCIRLEFTGYDMVAAATTSWKDVSDDIESCISGKIELAGIELQDFQLREVKLSDDVQAAINAAVSAQQNIKQQRFNFAAALIAADITRTQAQATSDAQQILACGGTTTTKVQDGQTVEVATPNPNDRCAAPPLTTEILEYSYIQALRDIANSPNNSTVIIGGGANGGGTPLINVPSVTTPTTAPGK
jgi:regulator of protease activity HflC (stomatin/prohibitin superfamily)